MVRKFRNEDIHKWYLIMQDYNQSGHKACVYCRSKGIDYRVFMNKLYVFNCHNIMRPQKFEIMNSHYNAFINSNLDCKTFCVKYHLGYSTFKKFVAYKNCQRKIEQMQLEQEVKEMNFIQVPTFKQEPAIPEESEDISLVPFEHQDYKQNEIEISIQQGVKAIISPNLDSANIIKIINFLKDF